MRQAVCQFFAVRMACSHFGLPAVLFIRAEAFLINSF
jgi:hypothetical protein